MRVRSLIILLVLLGLARSAMAQAAKPAPPRFAISKDTTYVTGPLRADGTIDYVEAINEHLSKGVTKENNAAIPLLQALMPGEPVRQAHYAKVWQKLGVPAPEKGNDPEVLPPTVLPGLDETLTGLWTAEKFPAVAQWLTANEATLNLFVAAAQRDRYYMPLVREQETDPLVSVLLPHLQHFRHWMNALKSRALLRLGKEDTEGFCRDAMAIVRLGRLTTHAPTLVEQLVGIACEAQGLDAIKIAATGGWLSEAQVDRLLAELRSGPQARAMYDVFEGGERGFLLEFLQAAAVHGVAEAQRMLEPMGQPNRMILPAVDPAAKDWNAALRKANGWYDRLAEAGKQPSYAARMRACNQVMADIEALKVKYGGWKGAFAPLEDRIITLVIPSMERAYRSEMRISVQRDLTEMALALSGFRSKTGEYPPDLKLLAPAYFKTTPIDRFTDRPLAYRLDGNGYVLSSLGPDGEEGGAKSDDLTVEVHK
jgi:hypothetical protein